jgi:hypothetical protein
MSPSLRPASTAAGRRQARPFLAVKAAERCDRTGNRVIEPCRGAAGAKVDEPSRPSVPCYIALALASLL